MSVQSIKFAGKAASIHKGNSFQGKAKLAATGDSIAAKGFVDDGGQFLGSEPSLVFECFKHLGNPSYWLLRPPGCNSHLFTSRVGRDCRLARDGSEQFLVLKGLFKKVVGNGRLREGAAR